MVMATLQSAFRLRSRREVRFPSDYYDGDYSPPGEVKTYTMSQEEMERRYGPWRPRKVPCGLNAKYQKCKRQRPARPAPTMKLTVPEGKTWEDVLTVETYLSAKDAGLSDEKIMRQLRIGEKKMNEFKKRHGLIGTRLLSNGKVRKIVNSVSLRRYTSKGGEVR